MTVILISGKAEAGKSLTSKLISNQLSLLGKKVVKIPYGDYVKSTATTIFGWDGKKDEKGRTLLQWWGTNLVRQKSPDFWAESVIRLAYILDGEFDYLIIDDARFPNEIKLWEATPFETLTIRVERPGHSNILTQEQRAHLSETALDQWPFDVTLIASDENTLNSEIQKQVINKL